MLQGLDPRLKELAQRVREVVKNAIPEVEERVKWGNPTYIVDGKNVASIIHFSDHVNLGFFLGAKLKSKRLEGTGKDLRHIKVKVVEDIDTKEFTRLLKEAAVLVK